MDGFIHPHDVVYYGIEEAQRRAEIRPAPKEKEMANVTVEELAAAETARLATQSAARDIATRAYFAALSGVCSEQSELAKASATFNMSIVDFATTQASHVALATVRQWPGFMAQVDEAVSDGN